MARAHIKVDNFIYPAILDLVSSDKLFIEEQLQQEFYISEVFTMYLTLTVQVFTVIIHTYGVEVDSSKFFAII